MAENFVKFQHYRAVCGIAGVKLFNKKASETDAAALLAALLVQKHRGPDNLQTWLGGAAVLGHNRLSIIDTHERSHQPFTDPSGRYSLVFNGEIYNYQELKNGLLAKGYRFETASDTEVLLYQLIEYQSAGLQDLRGCFAFAFYDTQTDYMLLARDRMGINPLLFSISNDQLIFGSELPIFRALGVSNQINQRALSFYFQYTYIPAPDTILQEVQKLLPGHFLEVNGRELDIQPYWTPAADAPFTGSYEQGKQALREKMEYAIISQLEADVPVGTFLSGGVDSSIVSAIASTFKDDLHTFSVAFKADQGFDESMHALQVAKHIQSSHHVIELQENEFAAEFAHILDAFDEPFADSSAIAMYFLSRETAKHLRVALSGDGADELFAGYRKHAAFEKSQHLSGWKKGAFQRAAQTGILSKIHPKKGEQLRKFNELAHLPWPDKYAFLASNIGQQIKDKLLKAPQEVMPDIETGTENLNAFLLLDQQFVLPGDMLKKVDLMSMRHSLEVRTPFMDKDLVKLANAFPADWKLQGNQGKIILKETFHDLLPAEIFNRAKQGFEVPVHAWLRKNWEALVPKLWFQPDFLEAQGIFNTAAVQELETAFSGKAPGTTSQTMWAYLVFQHWYQKNN
jgi:asparagine synthase (glutamine-hydrolysing)